MFLVGKAKIAHSNHTNKLVYSLSGSFDPQMKL